MAKEVKIVIKAYNQTKAAFQSVAASVKSFGKGDFGKGFGQLGQALSQFGRTAGMLASKALAGFKAIGTAAAAASVAVIAVGKKAIEAYKEQAQASAKLDQALKNSAYAAGYTTSELEDMATALQKTTGVQDEATLGVMAFLAASGKIRGDNFKRATEAAIDMGAAMRAAGDDSAGVEEKAQMLAKALEDPAEGLSKLTRIGIYFTDAQKESIKAMTEAGDTAGAQAAILAEVERRYKGTASAMHQNTKAQDDLKIGFGELMEQVGGAINSSQGFKNIIQQVADVVNNLAESGKIDVWAENVSKALSGIAAAVKPVIAAFGFIGTLVDKAAAFGGGFAGAQGGLYERLKAGTEMAVSTEERGAEELADIKQRKSKAKQERAEKEKAAQEAAKSELAARDASEEKARLEAAAAKAREESAKKAKELDDERLKTIKEIADLEEQIADKEADKARLEITERWQGELEKARGQAEAIGDELDRRMDMGAVGSAQWRQNMREEAKHAKDISKLQKERHRLGMGQLSAEQEGKLSASDVKEEKAYNRLARRLGSKGPQGFFGMSREDAIAAASKQGKKLSKEALEYIDRHQLRMEKVKNEAEAAKAMANLLAQQKKELEDEKKWRADSLAAMVDQKKSLDTLLRASR